MKRRRDYKQKKHDYGVVFGIIRTALEDIVKKPDWKAWRQSSRKSYKLKIRKRDVKSARKFIFHGVFLELCDACNVDGELIRRQINSYKNKDLPLNRG